MTHSILKHRFVKLQYFGHLMQRADSFGKDPDAGKDWGQEEKGTTEDEMAGWRYQLDGHEFEWTPGVGDGQGGLVCCNSWGHKVSNTTEWLNWSELSVSHSVVFNSLWPPWTNSGLVCYFLLLVIIDIWDNSTFLPSQIIPATYIFLFLHLWKNVYKITTRLWKAGRVQCYDRFKLK